MWEKPCRRIVETASCLRIQETRLVIERGPAIRNANCEDTETVSLTKVGKFLMLLCLPRSNDKRSFLLCLDAVVRSAKIAGTEQYSTAMSGGLEGRLAAAQHGEGPPGDAGKSRRNSWRNSRRW